MLPISEHNTTTHVRGSGFLLKNLSPIVWVLFLFLYIEARLIFHILDFEGFSITYKAAYHIVFFIPLGIFLWRREFSILNVVMILIVLALIPEGYQYYLALTVPLKIHLLDFFLNIIGGIVGICIGILWTLKNLITR